MSKVFHRPENYDPVKDLTGKRWQVWQGGDDWHDATTSCWVDLQASDGLRRVWFQIKHPDSVYAGETKQADIPAAKAHASKAAPTWVKVMKRLRSEDEFPGSSDEPYFVAALQDPEMQEFVKAHGVDITRWESSEKSASCEEEAVPCEKHDVPAGTYDGLQYGYCLEVAGKKIKTKRGIRCTREHGFDRKVRVDENGSVFIQHPAAKSASTAQTVPLTGSEAIAHALSRLDPDALEQEMRQIIRTKKVSKRPRAVAVLNTLEGLRRNQMKPSDLMISSVPVLPAQFRPFSIVGSTFTPGDANELYRDLFKVRDAYQESRAELGDEGTREARLHLYDAVRALYGYRDPVEPKTLQRGVSGFLQKITGSNPKLGFVQKKLLAKPMDNVGRAVIGIDPDLGMDEVGVPKEMAWKMYAPYIQSRLVQGGMAATDAVRAIRDRSEHALKALEREVKVRPVIGSRAPSWHRFSTVSGHPKLIDGDTIMVNQYVTAGMGGDFDGDNIQLHVPSMDDAVKEAYEKLMPSKMLFSDRDYDKVPSVPKHEAVLGAYTAAARPATQTHTFNDEASAVDAIRKGKVRLNDEVSLPASFLPRSKNSAPGKIS